MILSEELKNWCLRLLIGPHECVTEHVFRHSLYQLAKRHHSQKESFLIAANVRR